jgi:5-methylcytosine-specific restriction endonuclease McrA
MSTEERARKAAYKAAYSVIRHQTDPEYRQRRRESVRRWRARNPDSAARIGRQSYFKNHEVRLAGARRWYRENADQARAQQAVWRARNRALESARAKEREEHVRRATPRWADLADLRRFYFERQQISATTGIAHHVDHIVPLRGKIVSGLHVPWNLRVIPAKENLSKQNKFDEALAA